MTDYSLYKYLRGVGSIDLGGLWSNTSFNLLLDLELHRAISLNILVPPPPPGWSSSSLHMMCRRAFVEERIVSDEFSHFESPIKICGSRWSVIITAIPNQLTTHRR